MSKRGYISRYSIILKKIKAKPFCSYEELHSHFIRELDYLQMQDDRLSIGFSIRTLQRDIREIKNLFGIEIEYSKTQKGYFINQSEAENVNFLRFLEAFDLFNALSLAENLTSFVHPEQRKPQGMENFFGLLHAIKNTLQIKFMYHKFGEDKAVQRFAEPYALKEYINRWYVICNDKKDDQIKSFGLDRLSNLEITPGKFTIPKTFDIHEIYLYSFGIIGPNDDFAQEIILSFVPFQGKYIKSLPLHNTQEILIDNKEEFRIKLKLFITHDFVMELLSYGENMKVIKPKSLIKEMKEVYKNALEQY